MRKATSWREKLADDKGLPVVQPLTGKWQMRFPGGTMAIPSARDVDKLMRAVPAGRLTTINEIRGAIARRHSATIACPLTSGIFAWIASHAAEEAADEGEVDITPYWRTLKSNGELNPKYPGGLERQRARLEAEGHTVVQKGKKLVVAGYEKQLIQLPG